MRVTPILSLEDALALWTPNVTDAGLLHLKELKNLRFLDLSIQSTNITDAGLIHLEGMNNLEELDLSGISVTDKGVDQLKKTLPDCKIHR